MRAIKWWFHRSLAIKIAIMMVLGVIVGLVMGSKATALQPIGDLFIQLLKMLIVPLVFFTLAAGVISMDSPKSLAKVAGFIVPYYVMTSLFAAAFGLVLALIIRPGIGVQGIFGSTTAATTVAAFSWKNAILGWVPTNIIQAMADANMMQVIFFALLVGVVLLILGKKVSVFNDFIKQGSDLFLRLTSMVMEVSPYGIFALVAVLVGTISQKMVVAVGKFVLVDYIACFCILLIEYPILLRVLGRGRAPVLKVYRRFLPAILVAATTTSSAATLPTEIDIASKKLGIPENIYGFCLPLGNTANMDGMAVALGLISVFALEIFGIAITPALIAEIIVLGLFLSIGAAGVKGAGIVMSAVLFQSLGLPMTLLPVLAAIWPIIDIIHTTTNVTGDMTGTTAYAARVNELHLDSDAGEATKETVSPA